MARAFGQSMPPGRYLEIRYETLVCDPEAHLRRVFAFLSEPWDPVVLDYRRVPHDRKDRHDRFMQARRDRGGDQAPIYQSRVGSGAQDLGPVLKTVFRMRAGRLYRELGYG